MKKIAFITSGGDAPGMNVAIRSIVKTCLFHNCEPYGFYNGFQGIVENKFRQFNYKDVNNIIFQGGTILSSSRSDDFRTFEGREKAYNNLKEIGIEGLIVIGGDGSFKGASVFSEEFNIPVIGVPGTIDNDIFGTDYSIGFDTALNTVVENVDKLRDTANSHHRMFFVEVMGRHSGYIALHAAIASGAEMVLIPEREVELKDFADSLCRMNKGERGSIFIVAEGDELGGVEVLTDKLAPYLKEFDVRTTVLGHIQRGGRPSAFDRILATRLGSAAVESLINKENRLMVGFSNNALSKVKLEDAVGRKHKIAREDIEILEKLLTLSH